MSLTLRGYQTRTLSALEAYFDEAATLGARRAFVVLTERPYRSVAQLPELPYICLRVPTGGGKTIMAAHAVGIAAGRDRGRSTRGARERDYPTATELRCNSRRARGRRALRNHAGRS